MNSLIYPFKFPAAAVGTRQANTFQSISLCNCIHVKLPDNSSAIVVFDWNKIDTLHKSFDLTNCQISHYYV
jgi:hypothetical protein